MQKSFSIVWKFGVIMGIIPKNEICIEDVVLCFGNEAMTLGASCKPDNYTINYPLNDKDDQDAEALKKEINAEKPCKIVTFGRVAMDALHNVYDEIDISPQLCHLYHPSHMAIRHWKRKTCVESFSDVSCVAVCLIKRKEQVNMFDKEWKFSKK